MDYENGDWVKVVRCGDCAYSLASGSKVTDLLFCNAEKHYVTQAGYCSVGYKKEPTLVILD